MERNRITVVRSVYNKMCTQLNKPANVTLRKALEACRKSNTAKKDTILWDPGEELCANLAGLLERELTFVRKKDSEGAKHIAVAIRQLRAWPNHLRSVDKAS